MDFRPLFRMRFPSEVILGLDIIGELDGYLSEYGFENPVYVVGNYTKRFVRGEKLLVTEPRKEFLDEVDISGYDVIVGVGGGKNLDSAKYLSMRSGIPYVLVPTLPSSDGISSPTISLITSGGRLSLFHVPPRFILIDQKVLFDSPREYVLSGYGDVVAKYSSIYDWWLGHKKNGEYFGILTAKITKFAVSHTVSVRKRLFTPYGIHVLLESLVLTGGAIGMQGTSRPASGSEHAISHALDILRIRNGEKPGLHGIQVGISTILTSYFQGRNWRWVRRILSEAGFPTSLYDAGIDEDLYVEAVLMAPHIRDRYTILSELSMDRRFVKKSLEGVGLL